MFIYHVPIDSVLSIHKPHKPSSFKQVLLEASTSKLQFFYLHMVASLTYQLS